MPGPGHQTNEIQSNSRLLEAFYVQKTYSAGYTSVAVQIAKTSVHLIWLVPVLYWVLTILNIIPDCEENKAGCLEILLSRRLQPDRTAALKTNKSKKPLNKR